MSRRAFFVIASMTCVWSQTLAQDDEESSVARLWTYGVSGGLGYFNFRNSLYLDIEPDPPGDLGEDWTEFYIKPWIAYERPTGYGTIFAKGSWAYARTDKNATAISGGAADSSDFDELYLGYRFGDDKTGSVEVAAGRLPFQIAHQFLLADGYADGGSRGGYWSNPRTSWGPAARVRLGTGTHAFDVFYLERDERPEHEAETTIEGLNYQWQSPQSKWVLGGAYLKLKANDYRAHLDGAKVWNLRAYATPFAIPLTIETELVREDNGDILDSHAWYVQAEYVWKEVAWQPSIQYRYANFEGDDPNTPEDEDYDPLFPGFRDWGTWWQGEIAGEYFLSNSNLRSQMFRVHLRPREGIGTGFIFFDFKLDQPGSVQGGLSSRDLAREVNWYLDWAAFKYVNFSFILARSQPRAAVTEASGRTKTFKYAMIYASLGFAP